jgi:hypothetical protein
LIFYKDSENINKPVTVQAMHGLVFNRQKIACTLLAIGLILTFFWLASDTSEYKNPKISAIHSSQKPTRLLVYSLEKQWILKNCLQIKFYDMSLEFLPEYIEKLENSQIRDCKYNKNTSDKNLNN